MIAKIIAYGRTREEALARLRRAMSSTTVVIEGGACNKSFVLDLLDQPEVVDGTGGWADTGWIDRVRAEGRLVAHAHAGIAVVAAAIEAYLDRLRIETARLLETAHGGRPSASAPGRPCRSSSSCAACPTRCRRSTRGPARFRVSVASGDHRADRRRRDGPHRRRTPAAWSSVAGRYHLVTATHGPTTLVEVDGVAHRVSRDEGGVLRSPAPALVVATPVAVGAEVEAGAAVVVLESHEDGDGAARAVPGPGQGAAGHHRQPGGDRRCPDQAGAGREEGADEAVVDTGPATWTCQRPTRAWSRRGAWSAGQGDLTAVCSATTSRREDQDAALSEYLAVRDRAAGRRRPVVADELVAAEDLRRPRRAEPQPARRRGSAHRAAGAQLARALPHLPAEPRRRAWRACPSSSGDRLACACSGTTAWTDLERTP